MSKIFKVEDLMSYLGIGRDRAYQLMKSSAFPSTKIGKTYFITEDNLESWLTRYAGKEFIL